MVHCRRLVHLMRHLTNLTGKMEVRPGSKLRQALMAAQCLAAENLNNRCKMGSMIHGDRMLMKPCTPPTPNPTRYLIGLTINGCYIWCENLNFVDLGTQGMPCTQCEVLDVGKYSHPSYLLVVKH